MNSVFECAVCRIGGQILRCARCQKEYYCSKEHQRLDWKRHKPNCRQKQHGQTNTDTTITYEGSSENEILNTQTQVLSPNLDYRENKTEATMPTNVLGIGDDTDQKNEVSSIQDLIQREERNTDHWIEDICQYVIHDLETFGVCVVDNFLGAERGQLVLNEVFGMYKSGVFKDGQLVSSTGISDHKTIRGDQITWIDGNERDCVNIGRLIREVDAVVKKANKMSTGALSRYTINDRTKAMVACYPGSGSHYVKHIDNPNEDGRCVTAIYYLNKDWDAERYGGILRIFPVDSDKVANIEPIFDRLLFFWSDRRNPHEVRPAFKTRYAITLWYFDAHEREKALSKRRQNSNNINKPVKEKEK